jgi:MarR family transcriptional regulator, organic hydroperoxide resistance regulator
MASTQKTRRTDLRTVSRPALLHEGSDAAFRDLIHNLMAYAHHIVACRDGFGALIGLTGVQYEVLMIVRHVGGEDGVSVGELAAQLHRSGAFATMATGRLAERGLIEKRTDPNDGRRVLLVLSPAGEALVRSLAPFQRQVNDVLFAGIDKRRFEALSSMVQGLVTNGEKGLALSEFLVAQAATRAA